MPSTPPPLSASSNGPAPHGLHLIIDLRNGRGLNDPDLLRQAFYAIVEAAGATLLECHIHPFTPQGLSGVALLAESHISAHTWPEQGYGAFDVFMCGKADPHAAVPVLTHLFQTRDISVRAIERSAAAT